MAKKQQKNEIGKGAEIAIAKRKRDAPAAVVEASKIDGHKGVNGQKSEDVLGALDDAELELEQENDSEEEFDDEEGEDADLDPFPEIDVGSSEEEDQEENEVEDEDDDDEEEDDEEEDDEDDDEEEGGYNSSDIDNWDESEEDARAEELANKETDDSEIEEELSKMIQRASKKPQEEKPALNKLGLSKEQAAPSIFASGRNPDGSAFGEWKKSEITGKPKRVYPAIDAGYDSDSSTEDAPNRIGNVPAHWYDEFPHIGYDVEGRKVMRPATADELDKFLATVEDPDSWMTAKDKLTGKDIKLTDEELDIIRRLQNAEIPDGSYDPYEPSVDWYTGKDKVMEMPLSSRPEPKSRFVPSKWEHKKVMKIVRAIRQGRITARAPSTDKPKYYNIWSDADQPAGDHPMHMPAPKMALPSHAESYNPPAEYLFDDQERKDWEAADPTDRKISFMPAKYDALRKVPGYQNFVKERFERCLDLYLAPRMRRARLDIDDAQDLLPKLPSPRELRPFPTMTSISYVHPNNVRVRAVAVDPRGQWLVTGADDGRVRLWDLAIARCTAVWDLHARSPQSERSAVYSVQWNPNKSMSMFAACTDGKVVIIVPPQSNGAAASSRGINWTSPSMVFATQGYQPINTANTDGKQPAAQWSRPSDGERKDGVAAMVILKGSPKQVVWHARGDYFATTGQGAGNAVLIHQLSKQRSQAPFARASKGSAVQAVLFHPQQPHFFVATQRTIRMYNLATQTLLKTFQTGLRWISSMRLHGQSGTHLIVGSYDKRVAWFDLELAARPYKILRYHQRAVRAVGFHDRYPLLMSASDDGNVHVLHATVYNDMISNPLIVPLKVLRGHKVQDGLGILDAVWHPIMPWLITAGADGEARLWTP